MLKELFVFLRIAHVIDRELAIKQKLLRHQCKMVEVYQKYNGIKFKNSVTQQWYEELGQRVHHKFSEL